MSPAQGTKIRRSFVFIHCRKIQKNRPPSLGDLKDLPDLSPTSALAIVTFSESMFFSLCARANRLNSEWSKTLPSVQLVQDAISVIELAAVVATIKQTSRDCIQ